MNYVRHFKFSVRLNSLFTTVLFLMLLFISTESFAAGCGKSSLRSCSNKGLCSLALDFGSWSSRDTFLPYVKEAKRRGLDCPSIYGKVSGQKQTSKSKTPVLKQTYSQRCNLSQAQIKTAQSRLKSIGIYDDVIDGIVGKNTLAAIDNARRLLGVNTTANKCLTVAEFSEWQKLVEQKTKSNSKSDNKCSLQNPQKCSESYICAFATASKDGQKVWATSGFKPWADEAIRRGLKCGIQDKPVEVAKTPDCDDDPSLCTVAQLCEKAASSKSGKVNWNSAASAKKYVDLAKSTGLTCGVQQNKNGVEIVSNCSNDPTKCSVVELCQKSTGTAASGQKFWRMDASLQSYVEAAKIAGLSCNVAAKTSETVQSETCDTNPSKCSMIDLCAKASGTNTSGEKFWHSDAEFQEYVNAAKTIGVTCGVQQAEVASSQQVTVPKPQKAQKYTNRKALVIGNANYLDQTPLKNPINDAKAVAAKLEQVGFDVTYKEDLKYRDFGRALADFERGLGGSDMSLFYYAGHGIEVDKQNYLIPVDAELRSPIDARYETVMLDDAISASLNTGRLSMVLIDACRDNPFVANMDVKTRSVGRGLSIVEVEKGNVNQIISFAASSGEVAEDGSGQNSPYASAIIDLLDEPNLEIGKMFRLVRDKVTEATGGKQKPVVNQDLSGEDIFLVVE